MRRHDGASEQGGRQPRCGPGRRAPRTSSSRPSGPPSAGSRTRTRRHADSFGHHQTAAARGRLRAEPASHSRCKERTQALAGSKVDPDTLRLEAVELLRHAIGFELWGVPLVDPDTLIPNRAVVSEQHPWGTRLPQRWVLDQSLREINSRALLSRARDPVGVLSAATGGDLAQCYRWREMGRAAGMGDELRAAIVDEHGCWGSFELFRASDDPPFDSDDAQLMREATRLLAPTLRRGRVDRSAELGAEPDQTGVVLIDGRLRLHGVTEAAHAWFAQLGAPSQSERTLLPIYVYGVVGRLVAAEAGEDPQRLPRVRLRTTTGRWAIVEAARLDGTANTIAVTIRRARSDEVLPVVSRAYGFTVRERELVEFVVEGLDTRQIAGRMFISTYTAKDHLKSVFDKLGIHSRRELVTGLLGQAA